ncbi:hypothetical protein AVEN_111108-1 [Araneus ventricosus]|uniref:Uncharacterized protein n=1 Tax=Araneus ventricosus TaxID=182803 RepID=A0A4Y2DMC7_ARAVE|nr:hypothetical protein AVEN_111108-1 [Araneus ventricosus]
MRNSNVCLLLQPYRLLPFPAHSGKRESLSSDVTGEHVMPFFRHQMRENFWHLSAPNRQCVVTRCQQGVVKIRSESQKPLWGNGVRLFILGDNTQQRDNGKTFCPFSLTRKIYRLTVSMSF